MKRLKRLAALALSAVMALSLAAPAFAAEGEGTNETNPSTASGENSTSAESRIRDLDIGGMLGGSGGAGNEQLGDEGSITITQASSGAEYTAYQVFALTYQEGSGLRGQNTYQYIVEKDTIWYDFVTTGGGKDYVTVDTLLTAITYTGLNERVEGFAIKWIDYTDAEKMWGKDEIDAANFAKLALEYYKAHKDDSGKPANYLGRSKSGSSDAGGMQVLAIDDKLSGGISGSMGEVVYIGGLPLGYYMIDSNVGTLCALTTTAPDAMFEEKKRVSTISKNIWTGESAPGNDAYMSDDGWNKVLNASVGSDLYYRITITPGKGSQNLVLRDQMSRITADFDTIKVYLVNDTNSQELTSGADYRLYTQSDYRFKYYSDDYTDSETTVKRWAVRNRIEHTASNGSETNGRQAIVDALTTDDKGKPIPENKFVTLEYVNELLDKSYDFGLIFSNRTWTGEEKLVITYKARLNDNAYLFGDGDASGYGFNAKQIVVPIVSHRNEARLGVADMESTEFAALVSGTGDLPSFKGDQFISSGATVYNYGFEIAKTDGDNKKLDGAIFELRTNPDDPNTAIQLVKLDGWQGGNRNKEVFPQDGTAYAFAPAGTTGTTTQIEAGYATVVGLNSGTYYIVEIEAPRGYNKLSGPQQIKLFSHSDFSRIEPGMTDVEVRGLNQAFINLSPIQVNGKGYDLTKYGYVDHCTTAFAMWTLHTDPETGDEYYTYGNEKQILQIGANKGENFGGDFMVEGGVHLVNLTGIELPHTGGMGTTLFYVVGGLLVVGAGVLLIVKKRMKNEE